MRLDAHDFDRSTTHSLLEGLRSYLNTFEVQLDAVRGEDQATRESGEHHPHLMFYSELFPRMFGYAYVVQLALIVEARLVAFCRSHGKEAPRARSSRDAVSRVESHLAWLVHSSPPPRELWQWLIDIMQVRDCIVREGGRIDTLPPDVRADMMELVTRRPGITVTGDPVLYEPVAQLAANRAKALMIDRDFCVEAVTAVQGLFGYLYHVSTPDLR